jgi:hypothetical protein
LVTATKLVLTKISRHYKWTPEELEIVRLNYKGSKNSVIIIQRLIKDKYGIDRTYKAIQQKAEGIGLAIKIFTVWSEEEKEQLKSMVGEYSTDNIAKKLGRTISSVQNETYVLGLKLAHTNRSEWYTKEDLQHIFGVASESIEKWIQHGFINYSKFNKYIYKFTVKQVRDFIMKYPMELTGRNIDLVQIIDIICPKYQMDK